MALFHNQVILRNLFADAVDEAVNANGPPGDFVLKAIGAAVATMPLNNPAFGVAASGEIIMDVAPEPTDPSATGDAANDVDFFELQDGQAAVVITGAVPDDLTLSKARVAPGDIVKVTAFTYSATQ